MRQTSRSSTDGKLEAFWNGPALMRTMKVACGKGISSTSGTSNETGRKSERALVMCGTAFFNH